MILMARDWNQLSASTKQEILDIRANGFSQLKESVTSPHYVLHYSSQGDQAVPAQDAGSSGTVTVPDFGTRWSKVTLVPTIANSDGREVPYNYTASVQ